MIKPYYQQGGITIYWGNCLEIMPQLAGPMHAIIADIPYGTTACSWDTVIPFAPMWDQIKRLITPRGATVLFGTQPFTSSLVMSNPKWFRHHWIYEKTKATNYVKAQHMPMRYHEDVLVFASEGVTYTPQMTKGSAYTKTQRGGNKETSFLRDTRSNGHITHREDRYPSSIIRFRKDVNQLHATQKPLELMSYLILTYSQPGDLILDFTMGSGTTLAAAKLLGRQAIGIDLLKVNCDIAIDRLQQETMVLL